MEDMLTKNWLIHVMISEPFEVKIFQPIRQLQGERERKVTHSRVGIRSRFWIQIEVLDFLKRASIGHITGSETTSWVQTRLFCFVTAWRDLRFFSSFFTILVILSNNHFLRTWHGIISCRVDNQDRTNGSIGASERESSTIGNCGCCLYIVHRLFKGRVCCLTLQQPRGRRGQQH